MNSHKATLKLAGEFFRQHRRELGLTQQDVADRLKTSRQYVQSVEAGNVNLTIRSLIAVAGAYGMRVQINLIEDQGVMPLKNLN